MSHFLLLHWLQGPVNKVTSLSPVPETESSVTLQLLFVLTLEIPLFLTWTNTSISATFSLEKDIMWIKKKEYFFFV